MMTRWAPRTHGLRALLQSSHPFAARALVVKAHPDRKELLECKRVVIKVGTAVVSNPNGELALSRLGALCEEIASLSNRGKQVMLISSGAVGLGRERIGLSKEVVKDVNNVVERQACAAAGQELLMSTYNMMFSRLNLKCAQVLITQGDLSNRDRYTYLSETLQRLAKYGVVPVINENDVVTGSSQLDPSTAGQVFADNDTLAALIGASSEADAVLMMTDVDAVFTKPPGTPGAERISVYRTDTSFEEGAKSSMGRGGMGSKIGAAMKAAESGSNCIVANGINLSNITKVFDGEDIGTLFPAQPRRDKKSFWLSHMAIPVGTLRVKHGAVMSLKSGEQTHIDISSIAESEGDFNCNTVVALRDSETHKCVGRAITQQGSDEIRACLRIAGKGDKVTFGTSQTIAKNDDLVMHLVDRV